MDAAFWSKRYKDKQTGWDLGSPSPPLTEYVLRQHPERESQILIPGAGRAYEAEYLWKQGYKQVYICDLAPEAKKEFLSRIPEFPESQYIIEDFFNLKLTFDVILEQTFFCALHPDLRESYVKKMGELLNPEGRLAGVLFNFEKHDGPPFGGSKAEYLALFNEQFKVIKMEECYNSVTPRAGSELFFELSQNQL
ncbi:MAG: SAM-dependent methyltransferase [Bacteroidia bacterium]